MSVEKELDRFSTSTPPPTFWSRIGYHLPYKQQTATEIKFLEKSKSGIRQVSFASTLNMYGLV